MYRNLLSIRIILILVDIDEIKNLYWIFVRENNILVNNYRKNVYKIISYETGQECCTFMALYEYMYYHGLK